MFFSLMRLVPGDANYKYQLRYAEEQMAPLLASPWAARSHWRRLKLGTHVLLGEKLLAEPERLAAVDAPLSMEVRDASLTEARTSAKYYLVNMGDTYASEPSSAPSDDSVRRVYELRREYTQLLASGVLKQYHGQYVAIGLGRVLDSDPDWILLLQRVRSQHEGLELVVHKVGDPLPEFTCEPSLGKHRSYPISE